MLELLWTEDATSELTRYKVLFRITTNLIRQPVQLVDSKYCNFVPFLDKLPPGFIVFSPLLDTVPAEQLFKLVLGHFAPDVALVNITFPFEVLSISDCSMRGINIQEHMSPNGSMKVFTIQVPFTDPAVSKMVRLEIYPYPASNMRINFLFLWIIEQQKHGAAVLSLHMTFGLLVLGTLVPFSHTAYVEANLEDLGQYAWIYLMAGLRIFINMHKFTSNLQLLPQSPVAVISTTSMLL